MESLPEWIYFNGTTYYFKEWQSDDKELKDWWFCGYWPNGNIDEMPAETTDGKEKYFLVSTDPYSKEAAERDLLERVNNIKPWLLI